MKSSKKQPKPFDPNFTTEDYFALVKNYLRTAALWPLPNFDTNIFMKFLNFTYAFFVHLTVCHVIIVLIMDTRQKMEIGLQAVTFHIANIVVYLMTESVALFFHFRYNSIKKFLDDVNDLMHKHERSAIGLDFVTTEASYRFVNKICNIWTWMILGGGQHMSLYPILSSQRILPIGGAYPFDVYAYPYYELVYLWQMFAQTILCFSFSTFGNFYLTICLFMCSQYDVLSCSLKNVRNTALLEKGISKDDLRILQEEYYSVVPADDEYYEVKVFKEDLSLYPNGFKRIIPEDHVDEEKQKRIRDNIVNFDIKSIAHYMESPITSNNDLKMKDNFLNDIDEQLNRAIKQCVKHHEMVLSLLRRLESLLSPMLFVKAIQVSLFLCMIAFTAATSLTAPDIWLLNLVEYMSLSSSDMFIFCYSGHLITYMSQRIRLAILRSDWRLFGGSARRSMSIILAGSSRPITMTAGKFYNMNLSQYRILMSTSFSYYTLMKNMQN